MFCALIGSGNELNCKYLKLSSITELIIFPRIECISGVILANNHNSLMKGIITMNVDSISHEMLTALF